MEDLKSSTDTADASTDDDSEIAEEVQNAPRVNVRPEAMITFEEIVEVGFTGDVTDRQNLRGEPTNGYGGSIALTVRNPSVGGGNLWKSTDEGQSADYKLYGSETSSKWTEEVNGEEVTLGVSYGDKNFNADYVEDFEEEYVTVYLNGALGQYIVTRLDGAGGFVVDDNDYDEPFGLFEHPPDESDAESAIRRDPLLRADMDGRAGALMIEQGDSGAFVGSVFGEFDGEYGRLEDPISDMDHEGYRDTSNVYRGQLAFDHGTDDEESGGTNEGGASIDDSDNSETVDSVDDLTMDLGDSDDTSYEDINDAWQTFVDRLVDAIDNGDVDQSTVSQLSQNFVDDNDGVTFGDFDGDDIADIVDDRL